MFFLMFCQNNYVLFTYISLSKLSNNNDTKIKSFVCFSSVWQISRFPENISTFPHRYHGAVLDDLTVPFALLPGCYFCCCENLITRAKRSRCYYSKLRNQWEWEKSITLSKCGSRGAAYAA